MKIWGIKSGEYWQPLPGEGSIYLTLDKPEAEIVLAEYFDGDCTIEEYGA